MKRTEPPVGDEDLEPLSEVAEAEAWAMVEASPEGMLLADEHGLILLANSRLEELFGLDRADLLGRSVEELIPERFRDVHRAHRTRYRARPTTRAMGAALDLWARRGDGSEFPVEISLSPLEAASRQCVMATVRDITARRAAEAERRAVLRALNAAYDGVFIFDAATLDFSYVNGGAVTQTGYSRDELLVMTPLHIKAAYSEAEFRQLIQPLVAGEIPAVELNTIHRRRDGIDVPVEVELKLATPVGQDPATVIEVSRDVSDRLRREEVEAEREISLQVLRDRERLAGDLHDLVIQRLFGAGMGLQSVRHLVREPVVAERMKRTISDLDQAIAELRSAIFHLTEPPDANLRETLDRVVDDAARRMNLAPSFSVDGDLEAIPPAAAEHLVAVLTETLSNVARHAEATAVTIELTVSPNTIELVVVDDGKGMAGAGRGNGMANLERRAVELAGSVTVTEASPTGGTKVHWIAQLPS